MARGAVPRRIASASTLELELEPRPDGITRTRPVTVAPSWGWWWSLSRPLRGSIPPQRLSGASSTSAGPAAAPATSTRPRKLHGRVQSASSRTTLPSTADSTHSRRLPSTTRTPRFPGAYQAHLAELVITTPAVSRRIEVT